METLTRNQDGRLGLFVPVDHEAVLQPKPSSHLYGEVKARIDRDSDAIEACIRRLADGMNHEFFLGVPDQQVDETSPYWKNGYFAGDDARALFAFIAEFKPERYVEIGSGNSTRFARKAVELESPGTTLVSVDPAPRAAVRGISDTVIEKSLLEVDREIFTSLGENDILFHDGSHLVFNGTDTVHLFLEILPLVKPGVLVHIHDISLPYEYLKSFDNRGYNEQYLLAALLIGGAEWQVQLPVSYANNRGWLKNGGVSFWMRRA